jgi:hypothetical protein
LVTNIAILAIVLGVFAWTQPAQAQGSPNAPNAPSQPMIGPFNQAFSGADFHPYEDGLGSNLIKRAAYELVRDSNFGIGLVGLQLPPGAVITKLTNDSFAVSNGKTQLRILRCPIGDDNCHQIGVAEQNQQGRHSVSTDLNYATIPQAEAYFLQIDLPDDSGFYTGYVEYLLPSSFLFMPSVLR